MPIVSKHAPGAFCWAELATTDAPRSKAFFAAFFGWTFEDQPAGEFGTYTMCLRNGKQLGALYELPPSLRAAGVPPHWMSYIAVLDVEQACATIRRHGGTIQQGPFDVMQHGRMAICQDPGGATFSIWQAKQHAGAQIQGESGTPSWFELATRGLDHAEAFYRDVFGWSVSKGGGGGVDYREFSAPGASQPMGGMMELTPQQGPVPPHWLLYFPVDDCERGAQRAQELGGRILLAPMDIPDVGRFAVLAEPTGATFAIIQLTLHGSHEPAAAIPVPAPATRPAPAKTSAKKKGKTR